MEKSRGEMYRKSNRIIKNKGMETKWRSQGGEGIVEGKRKEGKKGTN